MATSPPDDGLEAFVSVRHRLFGIAYRMLGSAVEAEDLLQDVWLRWQMTDRSAVQDPSAFLATVTTRLAINMLKSAPARREAYVGPWLPEPVDTGPDPQLGAERGEALAFAVLVLLEKLSATERAAYVLREAFNYPYEDIAQVLRLSEANSRQLVSRARKHISEGRRAPVSPGEQRRLLDAFVAAAQGSDTTALEGLFAADVVSYADGGGLVHVARKPVTGRARVAKYISSIGPFLSGAELVRANGQWSARISRAGEVIALVTVGAAPQGIHEVMWMMRPSKLGMVRGTASKSHERPR